MPILIRRKGSENYLVSPSDFSKENQLEDVLADFPDLLTEDEDENIALRLVARQLVLPAGKLDLLFVDSEGLLIAVEVKLARNAEGRREVVAQAIDYISSLTELTVDELNNKVGGQLRAKLRELAGGDDSEFDSLWQSVVENLRNERARLVVVLDEAPSDLRRIFRYLARKSRLDVQLVEVQQYSSSSGDAVFVPQTLVSPESADRPARLEPHTELIAAFDAYNALAAEDILAYGSAPNYRIVRPADWRPKIVSYGFQWRRDYLAVELQISRRIRDEATRQALASVLAPFSGKSIANGEKSLVWDKDRPSPRLFAEFPATAAPEIIALAMRDLIAMTRHVVGEKLKELARAAARGDQTKTADSAAAS